MRPAMARARGPTWCPRSPCRCAWPNVDRLIAAGLLQDAALVEELVARAWCDIIAARLPIAAREDAERPSLLPRLANGPDRVIASAASAAMAADVRRQGRDSDAGRNDLPAELHHRLVWWVAASLRPSSAPATTDAALTDAARRALAAHDEGARLEAATGRLAAALDPDLSELPALVEEAFEDRRLVLVIALLAQGLSIDADLARQIVLDPEGDRLWLALRALDFPRAGIARIALVGHSLGALFATNFAAHHARRVSALALLSPALGYRVSPMEVEAVLATHPDIAEVACTELAVRPDVHVVGAFVVLKHDAKEDSAGILAFAAERLAAYKCPREIRFLDQLPRTANGKVKRASLSLT